MSSDPLLEVEDLKVQFPTDEGVVRAVDGISFEISRGDVVGLVGESGAGKSVAISAILRLVENPGKIVGGRIKFNGELIFGLEEDADGTVREAEEMLLEHELRSKIRGREIAIIFQDPMESLNPVFTVGNQLREIIRLNRDMTGAELEEYAIDMLREVGLPKPAERIDDYPHEFSGGMRQRVLIAMAFACQPKLIIADEPTTALDVTVEGQILELVDDLQERYDTSFLWVTHDLGVVAEICDYVNVMYLGEIIEQAPIRDIFHNNKHPYTQALLNSVPRPDSSEQELQPIKGVMPEAINPPSGCRFHTRCPEAREICTTKEPTLIHPSEADQKDHYVSCLIHEDEGYEDSDPLNSGPEDGIGVSNTIAETVTEINDDN